MLSRTKSLNKVSLRNLSKYINIKAIRACPLNNPITHKISTWWTNLTKYSTNSSLQEMFRLSRSIKVSALPLWNCIEDPETIIDHIADTTVSIKQNLTRIEDAVKSVCQELSKDTIPTRNRCPSPSYSPIHGTDHVNHSSPEISFDEAPIASMEETTETQCDTKPSKLSSPNS